MRQKVLIEVALCERCGEESLWSLARRAGLPICQHCASADVSRCEREQTAQETARIIETLDARRNRARACKHGYWLTGGQCRPEVCE